MVSESGHVIPLEDATGLFDETVVGAKAANLSRLLRAGYRVPSGFCISASAYAEFVRDARIETAIRMELGRKPFEDMRWEEIWDAALRIRSLFLAQPLSASLERALSDAIKRVSPSRRLVVRSSALGEDSAGRSFAGLHESIVGVSGTRALFDAVRLVWASLWSDAALLYRQELGLDPARSRMAVLVQELVEADRSGVAFGRDPRDFTRDRAIVEAVPGRCSGLVDGAVDPDRWEIDRDSRRVAAWFPGTRDDDRPNVTPLLETEELAGLLDVVFSIEETFRWAPDVEWTGTRSSLTVLQARPITRSQEVAEDSEAAKDPRDWYLTLRPGDERLRSLRDRVSGELIPELAAAGERFATQDLEPLTDGELADAVEERGRAFTRWKEVYWDEFIPFAHGVRKLATYYNDAVRPEDPYEFVGLLRDQPLRANERNQALRALAALLVDNDELRHAVDALLEPAVAPLTRDRLRAGVVAAPGGEEFAGALEQVLDRFLDITCDEERLEDQLEALLENLVELSAVLNENVTAIPSDAVDVPSVLERRLLEAVGKERRDEALEWIETGRVSWKLRDDDNLLLARVESQLLRALQEATARLAARGRIIGDGPAGQDDVVAIVGALRDPARAPIVLAERSPPPASTPSGREARGLNREGGTPRQLVGQPASPGLATGPVRCLRGNRDLGSFRHGEILVCDAIQPSMTHLVPLASAVVERRGGMLIHGAIIARELGIPCVNGVQQAVDRLRNGQLVTVDGHLGIVTVGRPEFDLELGHGDRE